MNVYEAHFRPPLVEGEYNLVQKGCVIPVQIDIGCDGHQTGPFQRRIGGGVRRLGLVVGVIIAVLVSGVAAATVLAGPRSSPSPVAGLHSELNEILSQSEDAGIHGGPIERFHRGNTCDLVAVSGLPGNWTHGDYVSAVVELGNSGLIVEAAHSDCGKPMVAVGHGGPPAHALANMAAAQANSERAELASETDQGPLGS